MIDMPHLKLAQRVLAQAKAAGLSSYRRLRLVDDAGWRIFGMALAVFGPASLPRARSKKARVTQSFIPDEPGRRPKPLIEQ